MAKELIWSYLIHLSEHMWADASSRPGGNYLKAPYCENNNVDVAIWDETVKFLAECKFTHLLIDVGDAVKYETHPEISAPNAWDKDFLKKKLDEIRALGITPIPKLNFSTCHDTWLKKYSRMVSTPEYYKACSNVIGELAELFGNPELFHLGFDEEIAKYQTNYEMSITRGRDLWWHDLGFFAKECEKHGARPWIWSDYYWHHKELFIKNMSKDILQSNWFYQIIKDYTDEQIKNDFELAAPRAYLELDELGFDQVPTSSTWLRTKNTYQTVALGKDKLSPERLKGFMTAPWVFTHDSEKYRLKDDAYRLYCARREFYPETL